MIGISDSFADSITTRKPGWEYACQRSVALNHRGSFSAKIEDLADNLGPSSVLIATGVRLDNGLDRCAILIEEQERQRPLVVANASDQK